jgi:Domain of unknown function (DUF4260)
MVERHRQGSADRTRLGLIDSVPSGSVAEAPRLILRGEGLALWAGATAGLALTGLSRWLYEALVLAPDLSLAAYGAGPRLGAMVYGAMVYGAMVYNAFHSTIGPAVLAELGLIAETTALLGIAAVWGAHIGFDRMVGYGLKYATGFGDIHLGCVGQARVTG